jgi:glucuronyl esterase-like protein
MHHTTLERTSFRFRSACRRLACGLPLVALAASGVAVGCGSDDDTVARPNVGTPVGDMGGGGGAAGAPSDETIPPDQEQPPADAFVEDNGTDCEIPPLPDGATLPTLTTLPDPFLGLNGERLTRRSQWRCRRQEIKKVAERFIYGEKPAKPASVTGTVTDTSITVDVQGPGGSASFTATITLPPGATGPVPAVIGYGGSVFQDAMAQEGVAFINYNIGDVGDETTKSPKLGAFYTVNPDRQDTGMLVAWSWGVSRMLDVIEASGSQIINPRGIGVTGCSRSGKGAFIAGAFDERVALTIPLESGMAGVPAFRLIVPEGGEVLRNAYEYRPWAGEAYRQFLSLTATSETDTAGRAFDNQASDELQDLLPLDTHEVIGMVAPRGLLVLGNPGIVNLAPDAEHVTVLAGKEIYSALGVGENLSYISNTTIGDHCQVLRPEYVPLLQQNLRKFLKGDTSATTGEINPDPRLPGQLGPNIAWATPALE